MATANELLSSLPETSEILRADLASRVISIPATLQILGVESDDDVKRLHFNVPRYYGEFDLSEFKFNINFQNARRNGDVWPVNDLTIEDDDTLSFSWLVDRTAFKYAGDVIFSICMKLYDENGNVIKELNTTTATLPVLPGLETDKAVVDSNPSAFDAVLFRLYAVEAANGLGRDGYYNVAKVEEYAHGVNVTIVNKDGTTIATIKHGLDGYTPIKGVDYWTEEDKVEIKNEATEHVTEYVNTWAPSSTEIILLPGEENWVDNTQTIYVKGVTSKNIVIIAPSAVSDNDSKYSSCGIRCVEQHTDSLTFRCKRIPASEIIVGIGIYFSADAISSSNVVVTDDGKGNVTIN